MDIKPGKHVGAKTKCCNSFVLTLRLEERYDYEFITVNKQALQLWFAPELWFLMCKKYRQRVFLWFHGVDTVILQKISVMCFKVFINNLYFGIFSFLLLNSCSKRNMDLERKNRIFFSLKMFNWIIKSVGVLETSFLKQLHLSWPFL